MRLQDVSLIPSFMLHIIYCDEDEEFCIQQELRPWTWSWPRVHLHRSHCIRQEALTHRAAAAVSEAQVERLHKNLLLLLLFIPALNENIRLCTTQEQSFRQQTVYSDLWPCSLFPGNRVRKEWAKPENSHTRVFVEPPDKWNINLAPVSHLWAFLYLFKNFPEKLISVFLKNKSHCWCGSLHNSPKLSKAPI